VKITRLLVLVAFFGIFSTVALADSTNDPVFKLGGGGGSEVLTTDTFTFTVNPMNEVSCNDGHECVSFDFINFTHATVGALNFVAPATFSYSCDPSGDPYFNNCTPQSPSTIGTGTTTISFFGLDDTHPGILSANSISGSCDNDNDNDADDNCIADNGSASDFLITIDLGIQGAITTPFSVQGTMVPAPESGTLLLVLAGGLGFLALKRSGLTV
jgi:hypothetical protein